MRILRTARQNPSREILLIRDANLFSYNYARRCTRELRERLLAGNGMPRMRCVPAVNSIVASISIIDHAHINLLFGLSVTFEREGKN